MVMAFTLRRFYILLIYREINTNNRLMTIDHRTINIKYTNTITHTDNKNSWTCHTDLNTYPNMDDAMDQ